MQKRKYTKRVFRKNTQYNTNRLTELARELNLSFCEKKFNELANSCKFLIANAVDKGNKSREFIDLNANYKQFLWEAIVSFNPEKSNFSTHLYQSVYWGIFSESAKKNKYIEKTIDIEDAYGIGCNDSQPEVTYEELLDIANKFRDKRIVRIIRMRFELEMKWNEIGRKLGCSHQFAHHIFQKFCKYAKEKLVYY